MAGTQIWLAFIYAPFTSDRDEVDPERSRFGQSIIYKITHVLLVTLVCKNKYRAPSRCIHDPTFRHSSLVSSSGVI